MQELDSVLYHCCAKEYFLQYQVSSVSVVSGLYWNFLSKKSEWQKAGSRRIPRKSKFPSVNSPDGCNFTCVRKTEADSDSSAFFAEIFNYLAGITDSYRVRRNILYHYTTGTDYATVSDVDAGADGYAAA